jgi:hypothetical protein
MDFEGRLRRAEEFLEQAPIGLNGKQQSDLAREIIDQAVSAASSADGDGDGEAGGVERCDTERWRPRWPW